MNAKSRVKAIRLREKLNKNSGLEESLGLEVTIARKEHFAKKSRCIKEYGGK